MGGAAPATKNFRNANVDPVTFDALTELARIVGDDIYLAPIPGCGSYQVSTKASAGTHAGGGAVDINAEGLTDEQARRVETKARSLGFVAYFRPRVSPYSGNSYGWQRHVHMIRRDCVDLAPEAKAQITSYVKGTDALAVPHKDTGSRAYVDMTWAKYRAGRAAAAATPPKPATVAPAKEADMPTPQDLWNADIIQAPKANLKADPKNTHWTPGSYLYYTYASLADMRSEVATLTAQVKALAEAVAKTQS